MKVDQRRHSDLDSGVGLSADGSAVSAAMRWDGRTPAIEKAVLSYPASRKRAELWRARGLSYLRSLKAACGHFTHSEGGRRWILFHLAIGLCSALFAFHFSPRYGGGGGRHVTMLGGAIVWALALCVCTRLVGLRRTHDRASLYEVFALAGTSVGLAAILEVAFISGLLYYRIGRFIVGLQAVSSFGLLVALNIAVDRLLRVRPKRIVVYSSGGDTSSFLCRLREGTRGYAAIGCVEEDARTRPSRTTRKDAEVQGIDLLKLCRRNNVDELIYCNGKKHSAVMDAKVEEVLRGGIPVTTAWRFCERVFSETPPDLLEHDWAIHGLGDALHDPYRFFRNTADIAAALALGLTLMPVWFIAAGAVRILLGKPVIYRQPRLGLGGRVFQIYKLRTMRDDGDDNEEERFTQRDNPRLTLLGRILRRTRIDELPQLLNVLKGDMVLIGPRPEQPGFAEKYAEGLPFYNYRHLVKPGISGWAQVKHHYTNDLEGTRRKLGYDLYYIRHMSPKLDIEIVLRTIVFLMRGAV